MKIGRRNLTTFIKRIFSKHNYRAILKFKDVHEQTFKSIYQEIFSSGEFPRKIKFKSPTGKFEIKIYSPQDFSTFNLIFCREDYYTPENFKIVVDIGSNIGSAAMYWLTRNTYNKVYCYEPSIINFKKLEKNLEIFKSRCFLHNEAISDYNGFGYLNLEKTGTYSSLNVIKKNYEYFDKEKVKVIDINNCLEKIIKENKEVDILKIDNEGEELKTVSSINKNYWKYIRSISVDGDNVCEYIPSNFTSTIVGSAQRFYRP